MQFALTASGHAVGEPSEKAFYLQVEFKELNPKRMCGPSFSYCDADLF